MFKSNFKSLSIIAITIILTLGLSISFQSLLASWIAPSSPAPGGNVAAPINIGLMFQAKEGPIQLAGVATTTYDESLIVSKGRVNIGDQRNNPSTFPYYKLEVGDGADLALPFQARFYQTSIEDAYLSVGADKSYGLIKSAYYDGSDTYPKDMILQPDSLGGGRVGVGTTSPVSDVRFHVEGKMGAEEYCDETGANCVAGDSIGGNSGDSMWLYEGGAGPLRVGGQSGEVYNCDISGCTSLGNLGDQVSAMENYANKWWIGIDALSNPLLSCDASLGCTPHSVSGFIDSMAVFNNRLFLETGSGDLQSCGPTGDDCQLEQSFSSSIDAMTVFNGNLWLGVLDSGLVTCDNQLSCNAPAVGFDNSFGAMTVFDGKVWLSNGTNGVTSMLMSCDSPTNCELMNFDEGTSWISALEAFNNKLWIGLANGELHACEAGELIPAGGFVPVTSCALVDNLPDSIRSMTVFGESDRLYTSDNSTNVGIGTNWPNSGDQELKLDVEGALGADYYCDGLGNNCIDLDACADGDYLRYDSVNGWACSGGTGPPGTYGLFLRTEDTYGGDLLGWAIANLLFAGTDSLDAADLICYNEITSNDFKDKPATIDQSKVHAFLCKSAGSCNSLQPDTVYQLGVIGNVGTGGSTFTTDNYGLGPNNKNAWDDFLVTDDPGWWTGRDFKMQGVLNDDTQWAPTGSGDDCLGWSSSNSGDLGAYGINSLGVERWHWKDDTLNIDWAGCNEPKYLICYIDP